MFATSQLEVDHRSALANSIAGDREVTIMRVQDQPDPLIVDGLLLMRAFFKIADAADRRKVIELAAALARAASPPIAPR
jgi:hypothetical protein